MKTYNLEQDIVENYTKLKKKSFSMEYFTAGLWQFSSKCVNTALWVAGWVLAIYSKHFRNFLETP